MLHCMLMPVGHSWSVDSRLARRRLQDSRGGGAAGGGGTPSYPAIGTGHTTVQSIAVLSLIFQLVNCYYTAGRAKSVEICWQNPAGFRWLLGLEPTPADTYAATPYAGSALYVVAGMDVMSTDLMRYIAANFTGLMRILTVATPWIEMLTGVLIFWALPLPSSMLLPGWQDATTRSMVAMVNTRAGAVARRHGRHVPASASSNPAAVAQRWWCGPRWVASGWAVRGLAVFIMVGMHFAHTIALRIHIFPHVMSAAMLAMTPPPFWDAVFTPCVRRLAPTWVTRIASGVAAGLEAACTAIDVWWTDADTVAGTVAGTDADAVRASSAVPAPRSRVCGRRSLGRAFAEAMALFVMVWTAGMTAGYIDYGPLYIPVKVLRLHADYNMFSFPPQDSYWYTVIGRRIDGSIVDLTDWVRPMKTSPCAGSKVCIYGTTWH